MIQDFFFINMCLNSRIHEHYSSLHGDYRIPLQKHKPRRVHSTFPEQDQERQREALKLRTTKQPRISSRRKMPNPRNVRTSSKTTNMQLSQLKRTGVSQLYPKARRDGSPTHPPKLSEFERNNRNGEKTSKWHIFKSGSFRIMITRPDSRLFLILQHFSQLQGVVSPFLEITIELSWLLLKLRSGKSPWRIIFQFP